MRCNGSNWAVYSPGSWDGFRNDVWALWAGVIMRLEHHLVGGYVRYRSPYIIIIIIIIKSMHNIGKVTVNASILYKNQEICNKTNLWKFQRISSDDEQSILFETSRPQRLFSEPTHLTWLYQLISLFLLRENSKNAFSMFVFILMSRETKTHYWILFH